MLLRTKNSKLVLINVIIYLFLTAEIRCAVKNKDLATKGASRFGAALGGKRQTLLLFFKFEKKNYLILLKMITDN
ncbi:hypothetical protein TNIN_323811 [Trichonephila inaurata madagascariensis]|uniref:Uncharacterized protein n=1 Tax=Trichonephila inaurata madagascariensis TaxID=2747483 RepID=A0A8X7C5I6_9ARAC|nr:hypothetical protein TNIN_323811 [Trichonephila inaurata madagascariensis]